MELLQSIFKYAIGIVGGLFSVLEPTVPFAIILFFAIILDCLSAVDLNRRLRKQGLAADGKFKSVHALKMLGTFIRAYSVIVLLHWVDVVILEWTGSLNLSNIAAAVFCFIELWSVLENLSSANGAGWAKILQRIMVSKVSRHLDVDAELFKKEEVANETNN